MRVGRRHHSVKALSAMAQASGVTVGPANATAAATAAVAATPAVVVVEVELI